MLASDQIDIRDIQRMADNIRMDLIQGDDYDEDEKEERLDILDEIIDLCENYLGL